jgi:hypothetical protein
MRKNEEVQRFLDMIFWGRARSRRIGGLDVPISQLAKKHGAFMNMHL